MIIPKFIPKTHLFPLPLFILFPFLTEFSPFSSPSIYSLIFTALYFPNICVLITREITHLFLLPRFSLFLTSFQTCTTSSSSKKYLSSLIDQILKRNQKLNPVILIIHERSGWSTLIEDKNITLCSTNM